jgi:cytochrome c-type biogenesis protein CcmH/NrfG
MKESLCLIVVCTVAGLLAAPAWAGSPSMKPGMPAEVLSWRDEVLPQEDYARLAAEWQDYLGKNPKSAVACVELARAMRYAGQGSEAERIALIKKAFEIGPDCPEALDAYAGTSLFSGIPQATKMEALRYARRASGLSSPPSAATTSRTPSSERSSRRAAFPRPSSTSTTTSS